LWQGGKARDLSTEIVDNSVQNFAGTLVGTGLALVCFKLAQSSFYYLYIKINDLHGVCWLSGLPLQKSVDAVSLRPATYALWTGTHRKAS
jgi:hypothetical protein